MLLEHVGCYKSSWTGGTQAVFLRRFDAASAHDGDGYGSSSAWLAAMTRMSKRDAKGAVREMRKHARHPHLAAGQRRGDLSRSWAAEIAGWLCTLPEQLRAGTEKVLADAAAAGASLEDLAAITARALALWRSEHPDPEDEGGFPDRYLKIGTTFGGAGVIRGDQRCGKRSKLDMQRNAVATARSGVQLCK